MFLIFLRLGLTSFGGPVAHLGYFHEEFVRKRGWFDDETYADLVALCQFLPGPASSQVGIAIGLSRAGVRGALAAWAGFTLPSAVLLVLCARGFSTYGNFVSGGVLHGLKLAALAVVAHALSVMRRKLCPDGARLGLAALAALAATTLPFALAQVGAMLFGGVFGVCCLRDQSPTRATLGPVSTTGRASLALVLFGVLLVALPLLATATGLHVVHLVDSFYRAGALVFGGGHVVLPLLKAEVVDAGWVSADAFVTGYGLAQAVPGPLFTFAAYLGALARPAPSELAGALICLVSAFLPSFLLVLGALPFWGRLRHVTKLRHAMLGVNAVVWGLLLSALYRPVWTSAVFGYADVTLALLFFVALRRRWPSWAVVLLGAAVGGVLPR